MAHFAKINEENVVEQVIVVDNKNAETEQQGKDFIASIGLEGNWLQTSYNHSFRFKFAGVGDVYDPINDRFVSPEVVDEHYLMSWGGVIRPVNPSILIDAPARSANIWTCAVVHQAFPSAFQRWGFPQPHSPESFTKHARIFDVIVAVLRNPLSVLASQIVTFNPDVTNNRIVNNLIQAYIDMLQSLYDNKNDVTIFTFESVTENPQTMIQVLSNMLNLSPEPYDKDAIVEELNTAVASSDGFYSLPIDNQNELDSAKALLNQERFADLMEKANDLYQKLLVYKED